MGFIDLKGIKGIIENEKKGFAQLVETVKMATGTSNEPQVSEAVRLSRLNLCRSCNHRFPPLDQCLLCGCVVSQKTKYVDRKCDAGKW